MHDPRVIAAKNRRFYLLEVLKDFMFMDDYRNPTTVNPCELPEWPLLLQNQRLFNEFLNSPDCVVAYLVYAERKNEILQYYLKTFHSEFRLDAELNEFMKEKKRLLVEVIVI